jgi:hypothetical protein
MPRRRVDSAGVSMSHMPVSLITATSARSSVALSRRKAPRLGEPISSSPSITAVIAQGGPPATAFHARSASIHMSVWPLSSTAPRATTRFPCGPSTIAGSKGGLVHSSNGSAGCTS